MGRQGNIYFDSGFRLIPLVSRSIVFLYLPFPGYPISPYNKCRAAFEVYVCPVTIRKIPRGTGLVSLRDCRELIMRATARVTVASATFTRERTSS